MLGYVFGVIMARAAELELHRCSEDNARSDRAIITPVRYRTLILVKVPCGGLGSISQSCRGYCANSNQISGIDSSAQRDATLMMVTLAGLEPATTPRFPD